MGCVMSCLGRDETNIEASIQELRLEHEAKLKETQKFFLDQLQSMRNQNAVERERVIQQITEQCRMFHAQMEMRMQEIVQGRQMDVQRAVSQEVANQLPTVIQTSPRKDASTDAFVRQYQMDFAAFQHTIQAQLSQFQHSERQQQQQPQSVNSFSGPCQSSALEQDHNSQPQSSPQPQYAPHHPPQHQAQNQFQQAPIQQHEGPLQPSVQLFTPVISVQPQPQPLSTSPRPSDQFTQWERENAGRHVSGVHTNVALVNPNDLSTYWGNYLSGAKTCVKEILQRLKGSKTPEEITKQFAPAIFGNNCRDVTPLDSMSALLLHKMHARFVVSAIFHACVLQEFDTSLMPYKRNNTDPAADEKERRMILANATKTIDLGAVAAFKDFPLFRDFCQSKFSLLASAFRVDTDSTWPTMDNVIQSNTVKQALLNLFVLKIMVQCFEGHVCLVQKQCGDMYTDTECTASNVEDEDDERPSKFHMKPILMQIQPGLQFDSSIVMCDVIPLESLRVSE